MRGKRKRLLGLVTTAVAATAVLVFVISAGSASLPGSVFEIDNPAGNLAGANLVVDTPGNLDWMNVTQTRRADAPTGANDDSYQGGTKEDTQCPSEVTGSIPNNKSDLLEFGGYFESEANGPGWLHVYWARVNDPSGTTNMDFEFNRSTTACTSGPNIQRTVGDVLLQFDVDQGGAQAHLSRRTWDGSAWGPKTDLSATEAIGAINQAPILAANSDGLITVGSLAARTFGEASFDLSAVTGGDDCLSFGSAMLKSRSSDSFTSQLKDFIRPIPVSSNNCGAIKITKTYKHVASGAGSHPQAGVTFTVDGSTAVTDANGVACFDGLALNQQYSVVETVPAGYVSDDATKEVTPTVGASCTDSTYVGSTVSFTNTPLTNVTISAHSQITGGTQTSVDCDVDALDAANAGDPSVTATDLQPQTIHCTIVIDP
jgi:Prealbumin-like fold domain